MHRQAHDLKRVDAECQQSKGTGRCNECQHYQRYTQPPEQCAAEFSNIMSLGRRSVHLRALGKGMPGPLLTSPPLAEAGHGRVVQRHILPQPPNSPPQLAEAHAELRLLPRYQVYSKALHTVESARTYHGDAAAVLH